MQYKLNYLKYFEIIFFRGGGEGENNTNVHLWFSLNFFLSAKMSDNHCII